MAKSSKRQQPGEPPEWIPAGGLSAADEHAQQSRWFASLDQLAQTIPEGTDLGDLIAEAEDLIEREEYAKADAAILDLNVKIVEARYSGKKAPWRNALRPHLLEHPEAAHSTERLVELLKRIARRSQGGGIIAVVEDEDPSCGFVRGREECVNGLHIHWCAHHQHKRRDQCRPTSHSLDQIRRYARTVVPRPTR